MSSIFGAIWKTNSAPISVEAAQHVMSVLSHCGSDFFVVSSDHNEYSANQAIFGSWDIPIFQNDTNNVTTLCDGEIYNDAELIRTLNERGIKVQTNSETELIAKLYEKKQNEYRQNERGQNEYGQNDYPLCINGPFAIAIWDASKQRLTLIRDCIGEKPLYYSVSADRIIFSSELKGIACVPNFNRAINPSVISEYFGIATISPPATIYAGIDQLPPGHLLTWQDGVISVHKYWNPPFDIEDRTKSAEDWIDEVRFLLDDAVRLRMRGGVGSFLSGGLDSSLLCALAAKRSEKPIRSFNIGFDQREYDESREARESSDWIGTEHHCRTITPDLGNLFQKLVWNYDSPFANSSAIATWAVCEEAKPLEQRVLSGDGGDELFGGYERYYAARIGEAANYVPKFIRQCISRPIYYLLPWSKRGTLIRAAKRFFEIMPMNTADRYWSITAMCRAPESFLAPDFTAACSTTQLIQKLQNCIASTTSRDMISRLSFYEMLYSIPDDSMTKVQVAARGNGLICRFPFLDRRLVECAINMPMKYKMHGKLGKVILRLAFHGLYPDSLDARRKQGFGVPIDNWFCGPLKEMSQDILLSSTCRNRGIFVPKEVERILQEHFSGTYIRSSQIYAMLIFELWMRRWIDQK
ncbi:MAG: asparagine synthase (glutamine-hydrolyzing) [Thermoguttaceae bacterium]